MEKFDINKKQNQEIKDIKECLKGFMPTQTILWIMGIVFTIIFTLSSYVFGAINVMEQKIEKTNGQFLKIETQLSQIQADLVWIKKELNSGF